MNTPALWKRLPGAYARRMAKWFGRREFNLPGREPMLTFTFDDFPRSALFTGGPLLERLGAGGTYYVSHGLMGQRTATGEMFLAADLTYLVARGHELGCHTFHHCPAWETPSAEYERSVEHNISSQSAVKGSDVFQTHSYPISYPRPETKRRIQRRFRACRGGGQTFNHGTVDLNYLNSFFLEQSVDDFAGVEHIIRANAEAGGWLIFSTHDICPNPTRFGCTPAFFEKVVKSSLDSGSRILTMSAALGAMGAPHFDHKPNAGGRAVRST